MTQQDDQDSARGARAIAEALFPERLRVPEWRERWDELERQLDGSLSDQELRQAYLTSAGEAGDIDQDVLATACLIRDIDI